MDHSPVAFPALVDQAAPSLGVLQALFDALQEALVYICSAIRWEPDPTSSEFMSHSGDVLLGIPLCAMLLMFSLR